MPAGKRVSAADMLGTKRRSDEVPQHQGTETAKHQDVEASQRPSDTTSSHLDVAALKETYERITAYLRPGQREWLEQVLDEKVRDAKGRRIKSISASDIIRLAIDQLQNAVDNEDYPLVQELIKAANKDAETFTGRKNRGLPHR